MLQINEKNIDIPLEYCDCDNNFTKITSNQITVK